MEITQLKPRKALNKAFLKVKPNRTAIEVFKANLVLLLDRANNVESEEFHKNLVIDFLKKTYYDPAHFVNTKGRNDLVIHNGDKAKSTVGVIVEAKKPTNTSEMVRASAKEASFAERLTALNVKAFQELVLYYLRERITLKNLEVKHLVATNSYEWFIFDAVLFERFFAQSKTLVKQFTDFEEGRLAGTTTDFFYKQIAAPFISELQTDIEYTYFDLNDYKKPLRNTDKKDDTKLIALYKLLSPEHLLKLPFANDSNSLDKRFYSELLHIIGLTETKQGGKKLIERNTASAKNSGSILEDAIIQLDSLDKIYRIDKPSQYGDTHVERLFNVALELSITWVNRILFLKLLEAQLLTYHKGDTDYAFLNSDKIKDYDDLNRLFFQVLARQSEVRNSDVKAIFSKVPYLNSSLFEPTEIEQTTLLISNLSNDKTLPIMQGTVLKDANGKKRNGQLHTLEYLFEFLNAYDFSSEGSEDIQEDNKTLINASVLGLIFEKINGYKDGSFFTPGFITMYMCRETIRKAVVERFNETKGWKCADLNAVYDLIDDRAEANRIVNSLKICDPAVGSGHFLVSALNEIIAVKSDLRILQDRNGRRLKEYVAEVVNDELIITDEEGELFEYNPRNAESQRVQETLFHEKQTLIENCLFGVDINPNSVKICRLRLWIELLKNAYYIQTSRSSPGKGRWPKAGGVLNSSSTPVLNNLPYLKTFRKNLRNKSTPAEIKLWTLLKGKALEGRKFRRQHSFANYILDFYCPAERLAIELDGQGHFENTQAEYDRERDLFLETFGIRVLRFENKWVWDDPEGLLGEVRKYFGKQPPRPGAEEDSGDFVGGQPPLPATQDTPPFQGGVLEQVLDDNQLYQVRHPELQTLPNIDINIKCGNSLISRFAIDASLSKALRKSKWTIDSYRLAVATYRNAENKEQKHEMERLIAGIKNDFETTIETSFIKKLAKARGAVEKLATEINTQRQWGEATKALTKDLEKATKKLQKLEAERSEVENNKIFENAFEWRFEFPEVLNDAGDFMGFDVVIGNPPYMMVQPNNSDHQVLEYYQENYRQANFKIDLFHLFFLKGINLTSNKGLLTFIAPSSLLNNVYTEELRKYFTKEHQILSLTVSEQKVFQDADVHVSVYMLKNDFQIDSKVELRQEFENIHIQKIHQSKFLDFPGAVWNLRMNDENITLLNKLKDAGIPLKQKTTINRGLITGDKDSFFSKSKLDDRYVPILSGKDIKSYVCAPPSEYVLFERPKSAGGSWSQEMHFAKHKTLIRQIGKSPTACFIDKPYAITGNVFSIMTDSVIDEIVICCILNSRLIQYFWDVMFYDYKSSFPQITIQSLGIIPIPENDDVYFDIQEKFYELVAIIESGEKTNQIQMELDQMIFKLYELTEDEKTIIKNTVE